jgi:small subunit ribosomal protein S9
MKAINKNYNKTGKRKCAIARVSLKEGKGEITVNGKKARDYFPNRVLIHKKLQLPFEITGSLEHFDVFVQVAGGGVLGQAEAVMYGIAKVLSEIKPANRATLKSAGLLVRDSRIKERKKYGRKKARKRFQFSKR